MNILVNVSGVSGSGKSTTMQALHEHLLCKDSAPELFFNAFNYDNGLDDSALEQLARAAVRFVSCDADRYGTTESSFKKLKINDTGYTGKNLLAEIIAIFERRVGLHAPLNPVIQDIINDILLCEKAYSKDSTKTVNIFITSFCSPPAISALDCKLEFDGVLDVQLEVGIEPSPHDPRGPLGARGLVLTKFLKESRKENIEHSVSYGAGPELFESPEMIAARLCNVLHELINKIKKAW